MRMLRLVAVLLLIASTAQGQLTAVSNFGSNPGNLSMFIYTPSSAAANAPVVMVMHGCTQNATGYANESDWNSLADTYGFYVIYPEQKSANNSSSCFNWFETGDINRNQGEALSLANMVQYMKNNYSVDADRVHVTGFSAGAAMAAVMMATYPDVFASGAINAGLPYKAATSLISAFSAMNPGNNQSPNQWGNLVRNAYSHSGDYPRVAILHGTSDFTVNNANATELVDQWTNVLGIDQTADADDASFEGNGAVRRRDYEDGSGNTLVVRYDFNGMGHAIAIDPGSGATQGGNSGSFTADVNFFSSYWSAEFFGLTGSTPPGGGGGGSTPIATPTNLAAIAQGEDAIDLSWTDNASNETAYRVERSANGSGPFATIANLGANASSYSDTGLMASTTYFYRVVASNGTDPEGISAVASETTNAAAGGGGGGGGGATITIEQTSGPWRLGFLSTDDFGQSFTATADGLLNQVDFLLAASTSNSTLHMYAGNTVSGTPIYSQTGVSTGSGWQSIALSTPLAVVNGQVYTVQLTNSSVKYTSSNAYSGGSYWYNSINYTVFDGAFRVYIETNAARPGLNTSEFGEALAFQVYPNPATDRIRLGGLEQAHSILLLDALGRQVMKVTPEESTTEMQVSHLRPGIYWLQVHQGTQVLSQRIAIH